MSIWEIFQTDDSKKKTQANDDQSMCQACALYIRKIEEKKKLLQAT